MSAANAAVTRAGMENLCKTIAEKKLTDDQLRGAVEDFNARINPAAGSANFNASIRARGNSLDATALESVIGRITAASPRHWGRETVVISPTFCGPPADVIAQAQREGYDAQGNKANGETVSGVTNDGRVYLVHEYLSSELVAE